MSEKKKHYTDPFLVDGVEFRMRTINVFEFSAMKQVFAMATDKGDILQLAKVYQTIMTWLEYKTNGTFMPVYAGDQYVMGKMNELDFADKVITGVLTEVIPVLFQSTAE